MKDMRIKATTIQAACERRALAMSRLDGYTTWEGDLSHMPKPDGVLAVYGAVVDIGPMLVLAFGEIPGLVMVKYQVSMEVAMEALPA